jgi:RHS repeat-associated protein
MQDDLTGLYQMGGRPYDPTLGAFLTSSGGAGAGQGGFQSGYSLAGNNPIGLRSGAGLGMGVAGAGVGLGGGGYGQYQVLPVIAVIAIGAGIGAVVGGGSEAAGQLIEAGCFCPGQIEWGPVALETGIGGLIGGVTGGVGNWIKGIGAVGRIASPFIRGAIPALGGGTVGGLIGEGISVIRGEGFDPVRLGIGIVTGTGLGGALGKFIPEGTISRALRPYIPGIISDEVIDEIGGGLIGGVGGKIIETVVGGLVDLVTPDSSTGK